jgi:archaellum component FlaF (FlaF/FlaG flagellin family)
VKKTCLIVLFIVCAIMFQLTAAHAQCFVSINRTSGDASVPFKARISDSTIQTLTWELNGFPVYTAAETGFRPRALTAAGNGESGSGADQLSAPGDVAADADGNIYILDGYNNRVQKWAPGATTGTTVAGGNGAGSGADQLYLPQGFFVDKTGNIYIADLYNQRVQKWVPGATEGVTVAGGNGYGSGANQLAFPHDVFVDDDGNVYVTDGDNNRVQKWTPGATSGVTVAGGHGYGANDDQFNSPYSLFVDKAGNIYVSDRANYRVQKWAAGATSGVTVAGGALGSDSTQLNNPKGIYVSEQGAVYIADYFNNRIQKWLPGAKYGITVAGSNAGGNKSYLFSNPSGVYVCGTGELLVADEGNNRVQKFGAAPHINRFYIPQAAGTYKVIAVYANGCTAISEEVTIGHQQLVAATEVSNLAANTSKSFIAYPNPVKQSATLQFSSLQREKYVVSIADISGKIVLHNEGISNAGSNMVKLNVSNLSTGMYIVSLSKGEKGRENIKLIKE